MISLGVWKEIWNVHHAEDDGYDHGESLFLDTGPSGPVFVYVNKNQLVLRTYDFSTFQDNFLG